MGPWDLLCPFGMGEFMIVFSVIDGHVTLTPLESAHLIISIGGQSVEIREVNGHMEITGATK